jgi:hypothetical protein
MDPLRASSHHGGCAERTVSSRFHVRYSPGSNYLGPGLLSDRARPSEGIGVRDNRALSCLAQGRYGNYSSALAPGPSLHTPERAPGEGSGATFSNTRGRALAKVTNRTLFVAPQEAP